MTKFGATALPENEPSKLIVGSHRWQLSDTLWQNCPSNTSCPAFPSIETQPPPPENSRERIGKSVPNGRETAHARLANGFR